MYYTKKSLGASGACALRVVLAFIAAGRLRNTRNYRAAVLLSCLALRMAVSASEPLGAQSGCSGGASAPPGARKGDFTMHSS